MKLMTCLYLFLAIVLGIFGCVPVSSTKMPVQIETSVSSPTPTITLTPLDTLEPAQVTETLQPLIKEPMNCAVPCFWGIIPGKTHLDEARIFFSRLGFTPFDGTDRNSPSSGMYFYTISYDSGSGYLSLYASENLVEDIVVTPDIPKPKEGSPREWTAYSPETLIKQYGSPSRVEFAIDWGPSITINMIMYFDVSDLIVNYSGYNMTPKTFCPLTAPFDFVRLWMGHNRPHTPSFETISLEKATSLTMDQFAQLMKADPKKACFNLKEDAFP